MQVADDGVTGGGLFGGSAPCDTGASWTETADTGAATFELTGGGGCEHVGTLTPAFLLVWGVRLLLALLLPASCSAADVQYLAPLGDDFVTLRPVGVGEAWSSRFLLSGDFAVRPLALRSSSGSRRAVLKSASTVRATAGLTVGKVAHLALSMPIHGLYFGPQGPDREAIGRGVQLGAGDLLLHARFGEQDGAFSVIVEAEKPVQFRIQPFATPSMGVGLVLRKGGFGGQALFRILPDERLDTVPLGSRLELASGYHGRVLGPLDGALELVGALPLGPLFSTVQVPLELLGSLAGTTGTTRIRGALGVGITNGLGTPTTRMLVSVDLGAPAPRDHDGDGLLAPFDACPHRAEDVDGFHDRDGCPDPDNDQDGLADILDECPDEPETDNGLDDHDGCPDALARWQVVVQGPEQWSLQQGEDRFQGMAGEVWTMAGRPGEHRILVEAEGYLSEPVSAVLIGDREVRTVVRLDPLRFGVLQVRVRDSEGALVPSARVTVEGEPVPLTAGELTVAQQVGTPEVVVRAEGYREIVRSVEIVRDRPALLDVVLEPAQLTLQGNQLTLASTPTFGVDVDVLDPPDLLDPVVDFLGEHPEVVLLRVEGHADVAGSSAHNYDLSRRRAEGVARYLVERGIRPDRLQVIGSGEAVAGDGPVRQVELTVLVWDDSR